VNLVSRITAAIAVALVPLAALAQGSVQNFTQATGLDTYFDPIAESLKAGRTDLGLALALMATIGVTRKAVMPHLTGLQSDAGGTLFSLAFGTAALVAGPMSMGAHFSKGRLTGALGGAVTMCGGWSVISRLVLKPFMPELAPALHHIASDVPVAGPLLGRAAEWFFSRWVDQGATAARLNPDVAPSADVAVPPAPEQAQPPAPAAIPAAPVAESAPPVPAAPATPAVPVVPAP